jgi:XTP/dITP diphosphohydrolase
MTLLVATHNINKQDEFRRMLTAQDIEIISLKEIKAPQCEENTVSFMDNAMSKAVFYSTFCEYPTVSDDSGLVIPALDGFPGIASARYGGGTMTQSEKNISVIEKMKEYKGNKRRAYFICALALAQKGAILFSTEERVQGMIAFEPKGTNGFGYDPVFYYLEAEKTFAELLPHEKDRYSHRGKAIRNLVEFLGL